MVEETNDVDKKEQKRRQDRIYICHDIRRKEGWDILLTSSISYDSALITLATAFLGFIFGIIKLTSMHIVCMPFLILILVTLLLSILCSLLAFWFDQIHGYALMVYADWCYMDGKEEYRGKVPFSYYASTFCKLFAGIAFFVSLILFSVFFYSNISNLENKEVVQILNPQSTHSANNLNGLKNEN